MLDLTRKRLAREAYGWIICEAGPVTVSDACMQEDALGTHTQVKLDEELLLAGEKTDCESKRCAPNASVFCVPLPESYMLQMQPLRTHNILRVYWFFMLTASASLSPQSRSQQWLDVPSIMLPRPVLL